MTSISDQEFNYLFGKLFEFFQERGYLFVYVDTDLDISAACEDPFTLRTFEWDGKTWPLRQTGQMVLEKKIHELPEGYQGCFSVSTSYRSEPHPVPGRHAAGNRFPLFEFEGFGDYAKLQETERELLRYLGFEGSMPSIAYRDLATERGKTELDNDDEQYLQDTFGEPTLLIDFPIESDPFWNMALDKSGKNALKVDVIVHGQETIGSAYRANSITEMREQFHSIVDGKYAEILFEKFGRERTLKSLEDYLSLPFRDRFGGGIGMTRLARGMRLSKLFPWQ